MKIVEKKCPNCGANLDFKVGERDVTCGHCRRKYAVEYDGMDFAKLGEDAVKSLKEINIDLKPVRNIFITVAIIFVICITIFFGIFIVVGIKMRAAAQKQWEQTVQDSNEWYERQVEEMNNKYKNY